MTSIKFCFLLIASTFSGTFNIGGTEKPATDFDFSLQETVWRYEDGDLSYEIMFSEDGKLVSTHPNDMTPFNDFWEQEGNIIKFSYNDGFSVYEGTINHRNLITGKASNASAKWQWKLYRIDKNTKVDQYAGL